MSVLERVHGRFVYPRRIARLAEELARAVPPGAHVLDVGSGDGAVAIALMRIRPDVRVDGVDVLIRPETAIPTQQFDGRTLPHADDSFDVAMLVDVVHHAAEPLRLLGEARRVARRGLVLKDHLLEGPLAEWTLRLMDRTGNARHGVALRFDYWPRERWNAVFAELGLTPSRWVERLGLYPWPASLAFDRSLHFIARLEPPDPAP